MTEARILVNTLNVQSTKGNDGFTGWSPWTRFTVQGPTPAGGQIGVEFCKPNGDEWFALWCDVNETGDGELTKIDLWSADETHHTPETGDFPFTIRLVSELDGVDARLFQGILRVQARDGLFVAAHEWRLPTGALWFDASDTDAPLLRAAWWLAGDVEQRQNAYLFYQGKRLLGTEDNAQGYLETGQKIFANDNVTPLYVETLATFPVVKAYLNVEYADMDAWHILANNPGGYEIKIALDRKPIRSIAFRVGADGRIEKTGAIALNGDGAPTMQAAVTVIEKGAKDFDRRALAAQTCYGNPDALGDQPIETLYAYQRAAAESKAPSETNQALRAAFGKAENLYNWYYQEMTTGKTASGDPVEAEQCQMALERVHEILPKLQELAAQFGGEASAEFAGEPRHAAQVTEWMQEIRAGAERVLNAGAQARARDLAPYRAVLKNDKLEIFEEHPAGEYRYYTSKKRVIETPEELANATWWYLEGAEDQGYITQKWSVRGWKFDKQHNIVDTVETSGHGTNAPSSAFK